jgi:hypothetical protein
MPCASLLIPLYLLNISMSLNPNIKGIQPRHFLLQNKDKMFLVSKCRLILLLALSYRIREAKIPYSLSYLLPSYFLF